MNTQHEEANETIKRRISEIELGSVEHEAINLNAYAAQLPPEMEAQWIVTVVRSFGEKRGITSDAGLQDLFQEALGATLKALKEAEEKGGDAKAFVKQAVRFRLSNVQKYEDYRDARTESNSPIVMMANPHTDFKIALKLISPEALKIWRAYKRSRGIMSAFARELKTSDYLAETKYLTILTEEMREALAYIRTLRRGF